MGQPGMAGKYENPMIHRGGRRRVRRLIRACPTAVGREILPTRSPRPPPPPWLARVQGGWPKSPSMAKTQTRLA